MNANTYNHQENSEKIIFGKTLPMLLDEACKNYSNQSVLNHWTGNEWSSISYQSFRTISKEFSLGLRELGLVKNDKICIFMHSDIDFCIVDMGCMMANLVSVPIHLNESSENIDFIIQNAETKALIISDLNLFNILFSKTKKYDFILIICEKIYKEELKSKFIDTKIFTFDEVKKIGKKSLIKDKKPIEIKPDDLATIIYTSGTTGEPKGVMLTHQNITSCISSVFDSLQIIEKGAGEIVLSFMPLTHITARTFFYGHLNYGNKIYFTEYDLLFKHLEEIKPTLLMAVPHILGKIKDKILESKKSLNFFKKIFFDFSLNLATSYDIKQKRDKLSNLKFFIAEEIIFSYWRSLLGGKIKCIFSGGAKLNPNIENFFAATKINILQGYGLTETSAALCCNTKNYSCVGTVGLPIPGVEITIALDGEILARGPNITMGYYKNAEATKAAIDQEGWFHTGDIGEFTEDGFLKIVDRKKNLFKLSTGKYIAPQFIEAKLQEFPLVAYSFVVGENRKFCAALIFPNLDKLELYAKKIGLEAAEKNLLGHPKIFSVYQTLVEAVNKDLPEWSTIKRFQLLYFDPSIEKFLLTSSFKLKRKKILSVFNDEIDRIYNIVN